MGNDSAIALRKLVGFGDKYFRHSARLQPLNGGKVWHRTAQPGNEAASRKPEAGLQPCALSKGMTSRKVRRP
jgi:hypothetical protein